MATASLLAAGGAVAVVAVASPAQAGVGVPALAVPGRGATIRERSDDQVDAIGGAMNHSTVDNVWPQHTQVGAWMGGPRNTASNQRYPRLTFTGNTRWRAGQLAEFEAYSSWDNASRDNTSRGNTSRGNTS